VFPEVGGGAGLNLGKDRVKAMIESFGGKVTSAISGKTNILIVGKDAGFSKVSKARANHNIRLMSIKELSDNLKSALSIDDAPQTPMLITEFSSGFRGNGLAKSANSSALAIAAGTEKTTPQITTGAGASKLAANSAARLLMPPPMAPPPIFAPPTVAALPSECPLCSKPLEILFNEAYCHFCLAGFSPPILSFLFLHTSHSFSFLTYLSLHAKKLAPKQAT
jgi:hypothetical protein